ncbi:MAG: hypothetical protein JSU58_07620 [Dehalococcoidales bacterium]|nr:MAG: hypothetical protein JSU58_07620 [Dehalococcoidales bacterium]
MTSKDVKKNKGPSFIGQLVLLLLVGALGFIIYHFSPYLFPGLYDDDAISSSTTGTPTSSIDETSPSESSSPSPSSPAPSSPAVENTLDLSEEISEFTSPEEIVTVNYTWVYGNSDWAWELDIPRSVYEMYRSIPRSPTMNYSVYITHPFDDEYINTLSKNIEQAADSKGYDEFQTVEFATAFVQNLDYTDDSVTSAYDEYPRYPIETLFNKGGDCEDTSILLASILDSMGYGVVLIELADHCAVGVLGGDTIQGSYWEYDGDKYYYIETTNSGWGIGQLPDVYRNASAYVFPMVPTPVITHEWSAVNQEFYTELTVTVTNLGSATAYDVYVYTGFDAGNDQIWGAQQSNTIDLEPGMESATTLIIQPPPPGNHTRLIVQIVMGEYCVSESYSQWFDS